MLKVQARCCGLSTLYRTRSFGGKSNVGSIPPSIILDIVARGTFFDRTMHTVKIRNLWAYIALRLRSCCGGRKGGGRSSGPEWTSNDRRQALFRLGACSETTQSYHVLCCAPIRHHLFAGTAQRFPIRRSAQHEESLPLMVLVSVQISSIHYDRRM